MQHDRLSSDIAGMASSQVHPHVSGLSCRVFLVPNIVFFGVPLAQCSKYMGLNLLVINAQLWLNQFIWCFRVINAGKSALNEDQACCEVVVARRRPMSYCPPSTPSKTPTAKRRNSLPNGEGLGLRMEHKLGEVWKTHESTFHLMHQRQHMLDAFSQQRWHI